MGLLHEIQRAVAEDGARVGEALLKMQLLAAQLGSAPLDEWVRHESRGYPDGVPVPDYRELSVRYTASWANMAYQLNNQPVPSALIAKFCGPEWNVHQMRQSIAAVDAMLRANEDAEMGIDASNLIFRLQGNIYKGFNCLSVSGIVNSLEIHELAYAVRDRILNFTIALQKAVPAAAQIDIGEANKDLPKSEAVVTQTFHQTIYGNNTTVTNSGDEAQITVTVTSGDVSSVVRELTKAGIPEPDAIAFSELLAQERPDQPGQPFGERAREWISQNIGKAMNGSWKIGAAVATSVLTQAALLYYGMKP